MIYEQAVRRPLAFIFSVHSCSSLSHSSRQSCLGRDSFTELTQRFCTGESRWGGGVSSSGTQSQSAANTAHLSTGNKRFQAFNQQHSITHQVFLLLLSFIYDALIWITVWQKTRSTGGSAAPASARPGNAVAPCCTSWPASSQGEAKERSTWVGWALFFYPLWNRSCCAPFYLPSRRKKRSYSDMQCPQSPVWIINADI